VADITKTLTQTLTANTATNDNIISQANACEIVNHGTGTVYVRIDGTAPTVAGAGSYPVLANERFRLSFAGSLAATLNVRLISAGTPTVSIIALP